ncbi:MAG: hypothetical protein GWP10_13505 [Nitrospiraceae bacterium]|nr:hypothetical protein [Nitrospiraceae bacterium]
MNIELCYKDPGAGSEIYDIIREKYPGLEPYSKEFINKYKKYTKKMTDLFGELASGNEELYIGIDPDVKDIINVNGSKYKLISK